MVSNMFGICDHFSFLFSEWAFSMRICRTKSICMLFFICLSGCKTSPHRPANVPASAVWIDGVFVDCSVKESTLANRCTVYKDSTGEVQVSGLFELSGAGREAKQAELRYMGFDGTRIWLQDARTLNPVFLLEYAVPGMASKLVALAGRDALDCGRVTRNQRPNTASDCARKAFDNRKPFYVSYDQIAWVGYTVGFARDAKENLYFVEYSNDGWRLQPPSEGVQVSDDYHIRFGACPKPTVFFKVRDGELTCIAPTE